MLVGNASGIVTRFYSPSTSRPQQSLLLREDLAPLGGSQTLLVLTGKNKAQMTQDSFPFTLRGDSQDPQLSSSAKEDNRASTAQQYLFTFALSTLIHTLLNLLLARNNKTKMNTCWQRRSRWTEWVRHNVVLSGSAPEIRTGQTPLFCKYLWGFF